MEYDEEVTEEQERVQKKTFTNWTNAYLSKAIPPDYVRDLFVDIRDGVKLLRLLEVLSGVRLPIEKASLLQRAHYLSNVRTALDFLTEKRQVKLVNINATDVVEGKPTVVLGLIWSIIHSFQIDESGDVLHAISAVTEATDDRKSGTTAGPPTPLAQSKAANSTPKTTTKKALLAWTGRCIPPDVRKQGVVVKDFSASWRDGRAFCALVHNIDPESLDMSKVKPDANKANLDTAFGAAEQHLGIPRLLDPEDVDVDKPDERSIMTYIALFLKEFPTGRRVKSTQTKAIANSMEASLDAVDSAIDPSMVLSASTVSLHAQKSPRRQHLSTGQAALEDEGIRSLLAATSSSDEEAGGGGGPEGAQSMPNMHAPPLSPRRHGRARTYADLRLARVAKTYSRCRAIANIRVTADRTEEARHAVKIIQLENEIKDSDTQLEEEREFFIHIKELISRMRHDPLMEQDLLTELEEFYQTESQHQSLTTCLVEMEKRKRQGILLGILPSDLAEIEAEWTRVKPALDEWRWRLDESLPGDWARVGRWLGQLERCLSAGARLASEMNAASGSEADAETRRAQFSQQLTDLERASLGHSEIGHLLELLVKSNTPEEPSALPVTVVNAIKKRFRCVCSDSEIMIRRTRRLYLRWKLGANIGVIRNYISQQKSIKCQKLEEATDNLANLKQWKSDLHLPEAMEHDILELDDLSREPDESTEKSGSSLSEEQPGSGLLAIQITVGGGTTIMRDVAETERTEASMFLSSLRVQWTEALEDLKMLEKLSGSLVETWQTFETETNILHAWLQEAEEQLKAPETSNQQKRILLSQVKKWRNRLNALQDIGATLIGQSTLATGHTISTQLVAMLQRLDSISDEVEKSCQAETIDSLSRDHDNALNRMNEMLKLVTDLINTEIYLPQTTSVEKAEATTLEYRKQLQEMKERLLKEAEAEYQFAKEISEKLMAAAKDGKITIEKAEALRKETDRVGMALLNMAEEQIDNRLSELSMAIREAIILAVRLAQMSEWIEEAEMVTNIDMDTTAEESMADALSAISPDEAIRRLKMHCKSINAHQKALHEAEQRLEELKASGLKHVNTSQLELAIAETRDRINIMLEQTRKREDLLNHQREVRKMTMDAANDLEVWLVEAESVVNRSTEATPPLLQGNLSGNARITQWSLDRLEEQRNAHEAFYEERMEEGERLLETTNACFDDLMHVWPEISLGQPLASDSEIVVHTKEAVTRVNGLRKRHTDVTARFPKALLTIRFAIIDVRIGEKILESTDRLRNEELRIESGEEISEILSEHEAYFVSSEFVEELPAMVLEMEHIVEELVRLEPSLTEHFAKRTEVRGKTLFELKSRAEKLATNMRDLPERWLDFDAKLDGLQQWTNELEDLAKQLCSEGLRGSEELLEATVAEEVARRYRALLEKFEEMSDSTSQKISMAERLNKILQELITEGGLSPSQMAQRRTSLARVLNSLHDLETDVGSVLQTAEKIVDSLDFQASAASEQDRVKRLRVHIEGIISSGGDMEVLNSDEMRRLLAERDTLIARVSQEKAASLASLMQPLCQESSQASAAEERLLQAWEDIDKLVEEKASGMRAAAQATEQFEEIRGRLMNLLGGAQFLLKGASGNSAFFAVMALDSDTTINLEAFAQHRGTSEDPMGDNFAAHGPSALHRQLSAVLGHLDSLESAEADIKKLRAVAELMGDQLGPEKSAELASVIDQLERDIASTKLALLDRLRALEMANTNWIEICEHTKRLEDIAKTQEITFSDLRSKADCFQIGSAEVDGGIAGLCAVYMAQLKAGVSDLESLGTAAADFGLELDSVDAKVVAMLTVKRIDDNGQEIEEIVQDVDSEVAYVQNTICGLLRRRSGLIGACTSLAGDLQSTIAALETYEQLSFIVETPVQHVEDLREGLKKYEELEEVVDDMDRVSAVMDERKTASEVGAAFKTMRGLVPLLNRCPEVIVVDSVLKRRWEETGDWLSAHASTINVLISDWRAWANEMDRLSCAVTQLADEVKQAPSQSPAPSGRLNCVLRQTEDLREIKARWKGLKPQTEALLALATAHEGRTLDMEGVDHSVPRRYSIVGDQMRDLYSMLQDLNTKLEGELDAQDRFSADVERLVHIVSVAEKRLSKVTGIWIASAPSLLAPEAQIVARPTIDETTPTRDTENATENAVDSYLSLDEAVSELKSLFAEITGPMRATLEFLLKTIKDAESEEASTENLLQHLSRQMNLLAMRALKRQYICEVCLFYDSARSTWFSGLRGLRKRQEHLIYSGATVEILNPSLEIVGSAESPSKGLKSIPVDRRYREDCDSWFKSLTASKAEILSFMLSAKRPSIPASLQDVEDEVRFEVAYTPQELDTASIAAGIFFVTGRRDVVLAAATSTLEPFSFYVDVGRMANDCDRLKGVLLNHWNSLEVYCTSWYRFVEGCGEFGRNTTEFMEKTISLVKSAVDLTDPRLERSGNHKRLSEIATQFRDWQSAFTLVAEVEDVSNLPLVSRIRELQREGAKLIELAGARALAVETYVDSNRKILLDASASLGEMSYHLETLVKAFDSREEAIKDTADLVKIVEQQSGLRTVGNLAAGLLGLDVSAEIAINDDLMEMGHLAVEMSYESDFEVMLKRVSSASALLSLLSRLSKSRTFLRTNLPPKMVRLQQSSSIVIYAIEAVMKEGAKPSPERLEEDALRNRIVNRCQRLDSFLDKSVVQLEAQHHTMVALEANLARIGDWLDNLLPRVQVAGQMLSVLVTEQSLAESYEGEIEDPGHVLGRYSNEFAHYEGIFELTTSEIDADASLLTAIYGGQIKNMRSRFTSLATAVIRTGELWHQHLECNKTLTQDLSKESEALASLVDRLDRVVTQTGFSLTPSVMARERFEAMEVLIHSLDDLVAIRVDYLALVTRIRELSGRCLNSDAFRLRLKRKKLFERDLEEEKDSLAPAQSEEEVPQTMSKQCANLTFRLASVDSSLKQCSEGICRRMTKVLVDAANAWTLHLDAEGENIGKMSSFAEIPLVMKFERHEMLGTLFSGRKQLVTESKDRVDALEAELSYLGDIHRLSERAARYEEAASLKPTAIGNDTFVRKNRKMLAELRQHLTEYAVHVSELESLLTEAFSASLQLKNGLAVAGEHIDGALLCQDEEPSAQTCETSLEKISAIKAELQPLRSDLRTFQALCDQARARTLAATTKATTLLQVVHGKSSTPILQTECRSRDVAAYFSQELAEFDKKFHWVTLTLDEADAVFSALLNTFRQYEHRRSEARAWLDQSGAALQEKVAQINAANSLDEVEAEKAVNEIQELTDKFTEGKRLVDVVDGSMADLLTSAIEANCWVVNVRQTYKFAPSRPQPVVRSGSSLVLFRGSLLDTCDELHKDLERYLNQLNSLNEKTEACLASCSKFAENCSRFIDWLSSAEMQWAIPQVDAIDTAPIDEDKPLWERNAMATTYAQHLQNIQTHQTMLQSLFTEAAVDFEDTPSDASGLLLLDAKTRFHWLQKCMNARFVSIQERLKQAEELETRKKALEASVERIHKRFNVLSWDVVELATWELLKPTTSDAPTEVFEDVLRQLPISLQSLSKLSQELEEINDEFRDVPVSPRLKNEVKTGLPDILTALCVNADNYIKSGTALMEHYMLLQDTLSRFELRLSEKAYLSDFMVPDVCRLAAEEWTNFRDEIHVEQSLLWQLVEEFDDEGLETKFSTTRDLFDAFVSALRLLAPSMASQCSAVHLLEDKISQLSSLSSEFHREAHGLQSGLEAQVAKGDLYHTALDMCYKGLDAIEGDLNHVLSSACLGGEMQSWMNATQNLVCKVTEVEGRLCQFQSKEMEDLMTVSSSGGDQLPLAVQAIQDRWGELVTRAMNARSTAESALGSIEGTMEAFKDMVTWINEASQRVTAVTETTFDLPSGFEPEKEKPRYAAEVWSGLVESRLSRLSKISKLHDEAVSRRRLILSTTEELGKLKGLPPSRADPSDIRALELELADLYADLVERCQTVLNDEQETAKTAQAALEDGQAAISAVDSLSDRASVLLFREDALYSNESAVAASSSLEWQRMCFRDFLSIELSTVRELVERSRRWLVSLPTPDSQLAELISSRMAEDLVKTEERIAGRLSALEHFSRRLEDLVQKVAEEEETYQREALKGATRNQPNTLAEKRELVKSLEVQLESIGEYSESVKHLSEELHLLTSIGESAFPLPPELVCRLHGLCKRWTLQKQAVEHQRTSWVQAANRHESFVKELYETHQNVKRLSLEIQKHWEGFLSICADDAPNMDALAWIRQRIVDHESINHVCDSVKRLGQMYARVSASTGSVGQSRLHGMLKNVRSFLDQVETTRDHLQVTFNGLSVRVDEFCRARQRFSASLEGCGGDLVQLMSGQVEPTCLALAALVQDTDNALTADYDILSRAKADLQSAVVEACGIKTLDSAQLADITEVEENFKMFKTEPLPTESPPGNSSLDTVHALKEASVRREEMITILTDLLEGAQRLADARKNHQKSRQVCQHWLAEASKRLVVCKLTVSATASETSAADYMPSYCTLEQKLFHLRTRRQHIATLSDEHARHHEKFDLNQLCEEAVSQCQRNMMNKVKHEVATKWKFEPGFTVSERMDASTLHEEFAEISEEIARLGSLLEVQVGRCENATSAVEWVHEWVRSLEKRMVEMAMPPPLYSSASFKRSHDLRCYVDELSALQNLQREQEEVARLWKTLREDMDAKKPEFDSRVQSILTVHLESDTKLPQNLRNRLEIVDKKISDRIKLSQRGVDCINDICKALAVYCTWFATIEQRAAAESTSITATLGREPDSDFQEGQCRVSGLITSIDQLLRDCRKSAMDEICPLATACSFSSDLLSDLSSAWLAIKENLPLVRQKSRSEANALAEFTAACGALKAWLAELTPEVDRISCELMATHHREGFENDDDEEGEEEETLPLGLPESTAKCLNSCLEKKEKMVSETATIANKISIKNRDFDELLTKVTFLRPLKIENISELSHHAEALHADYSRLCSETREYCRQADDILATHLAYLTACEAFRGWCGELQQSLLLVADFSGDRYTLMARFDRLTNLDSIHQLSETKISNLKKATRSCLTSSPSGSMSSITSNTVYAVNTFKTIFCRIVEIRANFTRILDAWECFDKSVNDFDASLRGAQECLAKYSTPFSENLSTLQATVEVLSKTPEILSGTVSLDLSVPGVLLEVHALKAVFSEMSRCHGLLETSLKSVSTEADEGVHAALLQRSGEMESLGASIEKMLVAWQQAAELFQRFHTQESRLTQLVETFEGCSKSLTDEESEAKSIICVTSLIEQCRVCLDVYKGFPTDLKDSKNTLSALTPCTNNATILRLQGNLTGLWTRFSGTEQKVQALKRRCEGNIKHDAKLKADLANGTICVTELENELQDIAPSSDSAGDFPLPKPISLSSVRSTEMSFAFFAFSTSITDFLTHSTHSTSGHARTVTAFREKLLAQQKEVEELLGQKFLQDEMIEPAKENLASRLERLSKLTASREEQASNRLDLVTDANFTIGKAVEDLSACVEAFIVSETNSKTSSPDTLQVIRGRFAALSKDLENYGCALTTSLSKLPTNGPEWDSYKKVENLLADEMADLSRRAESMASSLAEEISDLCEIASLEKQMTQSHSAFLTKLSGLSNSLPVPPKQVDADRKDTISTLENFLVEVQNVRKDVAAETADFKHKATTLVSKLTDTLNRYSGHRGLPIGLFAARLDQHKVALEEGERKGTRFDRELDDDVSKWEKFLGYGRELRHILASRESDLEVFTTTGTTLERVESLRGLEECLREQSKQLLERMTVSGSKLAALRSNSCLVDPVVEALTSRYDVLLRTIKTRQNDIKVVIIAEDDLKSECAACRQMLTSHEAHLDGLCKSPIILSHGSYALECIGERIQQLGKFSKEISTMNKEHLEPFEFRVQQTRAQLKDCGFDQSELDSVTRTTADMTALSASLQRTSSTCVAELKRLSKAWKTFLNFSTKSNIWLKTQEDSFTELDCELRVSDYTDIRQLTSQLSERANAIHQLCVELHRTGNQRMLDCSSKCSWLLDVIRSIKCFMVQNSSTKNPSLKDLIGELQEQHSSLLARATRRKDELSGLLLSLTAFDELFTSLETWMLAVETEMSFTSGVGENTISLWSTPVSYLAIRASDLLSQLAQGHERATQIAEKQAHLDVLLTRSNRLLEDQPSSTVSRFVAQRTGALSRKFVELTALVRRHLEQASLSLKGIEKLQAARDTYTKWDKALRLKFAQTKVECIPSKALLAVKHVAASLPMGEVLLDACRRWSISVQKEALATSVDGVSDPTLAQDLVESFASLQKTVMQCQKEAETNLTDLQVKRLNFDNASSWLDAAERRMLAICASIFSPPITDLRGSQLASILTNYEQKTANGITELIGIQAEITDHDDSQLTAKLYSFKTRLDQMVKQAEARLRDLRSHRESTEIVAMRHQITLERFTQTTGENLVEDDFQLQRDVLQLLISYYDAERRLTVLRGLYDELVVEGRPLVEVMINSADQLISEDDSFLTEAVTQQSEELRCQQAELERATRKTIEQLEAVCQAWRGVAVSEEKIESWLTEMEQTVMGPKKDAEGSVAEKKKTLEAMQAFESTINQRAADIQRHLEEAEAFNSRVRHLQIADKARHLAKRFSLLSDSVKDQIHEFMGTIEGVQDFEMMLSHLLSTVGDTKRLVEDCCKEKPPSDRMELSARLSLLVTALKQLETIKNSNEFRDLAAQMDVVKAHIAPETFDTYSQQVSGVVSFVDDSMRRLGGIEKLLNSRLQKWQEWSDLVDGMINEMDRLDADFTRNLQTGRALDMSAVDQLQARRNTLEKLGALFSTAVSMRTQFSKLKRAIQDKDAAALDSVLHNHSVELMARYKRFKKSVKTQKDLMKRQWERLFAFATKISTADQWLLSAVVKLTALNNAQPDGPKAIDFLCRSCETLLVEVEGFLRGQLGPLLTEARALLRGAGKQEKDSSAASTSTLLLQQAEVMEAEANGLLGLVESIQANFRGMSGRWEELQLTVEGGETYLDEKLTIWWNEFSDRTQRIEASDVAPVLRLQNEEQLDAISTDVLTAVKDIETRLFDLDNATGALGTPWSPVQLPQVLRKRLEGVARVGGPTSLLAESVSTNAATSGSLLRGRAARLRDCYTTEIQKMRTLSDQLISWRSRWNHQLLCEAEFAHLLASKEAEAKRISETTDSHLPSSLDTGGLKRLRNELAAKRAVLDELASWRRDLLLPVAMETGSGEVDHLRQQLDALVEKINRRIQLHKKVAREARKATNLKTELQADLNTMVKRVSNGRSRSHCRADHCSLGASSLHGARSSPMISRRGRSPIDIQVPTSPSPVAGSLEWLWYSPTSLLDHTTAPVHFTPQLEDPDYYNRRENYEYSPSPPRLPLRPQGPSDSSLTARSTPLITRPRRGSNFLSRRSFALDQFVDLKADEGAFSVPAGSTPTLVSRPATPILLLRRSLSPRFRGRLGSLTTATTATAQQQAPSLLATVGLVNTRQYSNSCFDVMPSRQALLPPRAFAHRAPSDLARKRYRKKLAEKQQSDG